MGGGGGGEEIGQGRLSAAGGGASRDASSSCSSEELRLCDEAGLTDEVLVLILVLLLLVLVLDLILVLVLRSKEPIGQDWKCCSIDFLWLQREVKQETELQQTFTSGSAHLRLCPLLLTIITATSCF